jgi:hypothetical protein
MLLIHNTAGEHQHASIYKKLYYFQKTKAEKKEKKEPPKYPCHMCDIPVMFALTALRRHLARKHSTNFKCDKEGCNKTFAKQYQVRGSFSLGHKIIYVTSV